MVNTQGMENPPKRQSEKNKSPVPEAKNPVLFKKYTGKKILLLGYD